MKKRKLSRKGWPKKDGFYWIQFAGDDAAQPCFYVHREHMVHLTDPRFDRLVPAERIGAAAISAEPLPRTVLIAQEKQENHEER